MKVIERFTFFLLFALIYLTVFVHYAYAQTPGPSPVTGISPLTAIGMVLGLVLGFINHGVTSGTILTFGVPAAWKTYLAVLATFLTSFVPQFTQMTTVTSGGLFLAFFAGVSALVSYSAGATVRMHQDTGKATAKRMMMSPMGKTVVMALGLGFVVHTVGCASLPAWEKAFSDVVKDIQAGEGLAQIEGDVAQDLGFSGLVNTVVATFVVDAIDEAIALGLIPPQLVPNATSMEKEEAVKLVKMGGHLPTAVLMRHHAQEQPLLVSWNIFSVGGAL